METDLREQIWLKLLGNVAFNPVTALTGATLAERIAKAGHKVAKHARYEPPTHPHGNDEPPTHPHGNAVVALADRGRGHARLAVVLAVIVVLVAVADVDELVVEVSCALAPKAVAPITPAARPPPSRARAVMRRD